MKRSRDLINRFTCARKRYNHDTAELWHVVPEAVVLSFRLTRTGNLFGIDEVSCSPITLDKPPRTCHVHGVPAVPESVVLEANARLVARRLAVTLDDHAVQARITVFNRYLAI